MKGDITKSQLEPSLISERSPRELVEEGDCIWLVGSAEEERVNIWGLSRKGHGKQGWWCSCSCTGISKRVHDVVRHSPRELGALHFF